ncbi:unnamed protein product [Nesidiocoris tenuis]|uniref:Uncharacterized protein n=1 Tax=Nesidiocoris tenuis TaxID=355587 RepID=A0A6H5G0U5_9HEMI|nr:unnamed protein product [Nesidiocoris tenuis]
MFSSNGQKWRELNIRQKEKGVGTIVFRSQTSKMRSGSHRLRSITIPSIDSRIVYIAVTERNIISSWSTSIQQTRKRFEFLSIQVYSPRVHTFCRVYLTRCETILHQLVSKTRFQLILAPATFELEFLWTENWDDPPTWEKVYTLSLTPGSIICMGMGTVPNGVQMVFFGPFRDPPSIPCLTRKTQFRLNIGREPTLPPWRRAALPEPEPGGAEPGNPSPAARHGSASRRRYDSEIYDPRACSSVVVLWKHSVVREVQHLGVCSRRTSANEERRGQTNKPTGSALQELRWSWILDMLFWSVGRVNGSIGIVLESRIGKELQKILSLLHVHSESLPEQVSVCPSFRVSAWSFKTSVLIRVYRRICGYFLCSDNSAYFGEFQNFYMRDSPSLVWWIRDTLRQRTSVERAGEGDTSRAMSHLFSICHATGERSEAILRLSRRIRSRTGLRRLDNLVRRFEITQRKFLPLPRTLSSPRESLSEKPFQHTTIRSLEKSSSVTYESCSTGISFTHSTSAQRRMPVLNRRSDVRESEAFEKCLMECETQGGRCNISPATLLRYQFASYLMSFTKQFPLTSWKAWVILPYRLPRSDARQGIRYAK